MVAPLETFEDPNVAVEELEPVERRIKDEAAAYTLHVQIQKDNLLRDQRRSRVVMINGGAKPLPKGKSDPWRANFNSGTHKTKIDDSLAVFLNLLKNVQFLAKFTCDHTDEVDLNHRYGLRVSEAFHRFLREFWRSFSTQMELLVKEMLMFGVAHAAFVDETSFKFKSLPSNTFLLPNGSSTDPDEWFFVEKLYSYEVHELWDIIRDESQRNASDDHGWNVDIIKEVIMKASEGSNERDKLNQGSWTSFEKRIIGNELEYSMLRAKRVHVVNQYVKEFDGKIRHLIIYKDQQIGGFMFDRLTEFEKFEDLFETFYFDAESEHHSVRGQGERIYDHVLHLEIAFNDVIDSSRLGSSIILTGRKSTEDRKNRWQKIMYLDESTQILDNPAENAARGSLLAAGMLEDKLNRVVNKGKSSGEQVSIQPLSTAEIQKDRTEVIVIQSSHLKRFYSSADHLFQSIWKRLISDDFESSTPGFEARKMFFDLIKKLDVPEEALKDCTLLASRSVGQGGQQQFELATRELIGLGPEMRSDELRQDALHQRTASLFDYATAQHYFPIGERTIDSQTESTLISLEINHLRKGEFVRVESGQRHTLHVNAVFALLEEVKGETQDINILLQQYTVSLAHVTKHLEWMSKMKMFSKDLAQAKPVFDKFIEEFKQIKAQANQENQQREAEAQAQQEAIEEQQRQQVDPAVLKVLKDAENERIDGDLKHEQNLKKEEDRHQERLIRVQADKQIDALEVAVKARND